MFRKINLLIFDLDGTVIDSKLDIANSVNRTLSELGLPSVANEVIYGYVGNGVRPLIQKSIGADGPFFEKALSIFKSHYLAHALDETKPFPGIVEVLKHFSDRKKAILTNKSQEFTDPILKGLGLDRFFDFVIGGESNFPKKPDPAAVFYLLKQCGCRPEETALIGDSAVDIETGKRAGVKTCGILYGFRPEAEIRAARPDFIVSSPNELTKITTLDPKP